MARLRGPEDGGPGRLERYRTPLRTRQGTEVPVRLNAAQAIQGRGRLSVRTLALPRKDRIFVEIADSGPGIDPEVLPHIFEPFFTAKPEGQGTGLGLSLARDVVERHDGKITVDSQPGSGTRFLIEWRRHPRPVEPTG